MSLDPSVQPLADLFDANCAAFTAKDVDGYFAGLHPKAWTHQAGMFMSVEALQGMADQVLAMSESFKVTNWLGGVAVDDTGAVWGEFEYVVNANGERSTQTGKFSAHYVRQDGDWRVLFTHYTPAL